MKNLKVGAGVGNLDGTAVGRVGRDVGLIVGLAVLEGVGVGELVPLGARVGFAEGREVVRGNTFPCMTVRPLHDLSR